MAAPEYIHFHTLLKDVFNNTLNSIRVVFGNGGSTDATSVHTMALAVYDRANSAIRVTAPDFEGAGSSGLVPDPGVEAGKYLKDDGTWGTPAGGGGGYSVYVEEADVAVGDNSAADITLDFDGTDFNTSIAAQEIEITVNDGGVDHNATANTHNLTTDIDHDALTNTHNLTTDIDHDALTNTHNLTTDIDHASITNAHNLTTDIDHDALTNFEANEHFTEASIDHNAITNTHNLTTDIDHDALTNTHDLTTDIDHDAIANTHNLTTDIDHASITNGHNLTTDIDHDAITNNHNLTTDIDHDALTNTHDLTTDIDHNSIANTHNLTTDIDHDALTNFDADEHFLQSAIDHTNILNKGTNTHAQIDTHIGTANIHFLVTNIAHGSIQHSSNSIADHGMTAWRIIYSGGAGGVTLLALGASGTYLKSNGAAAAPTWDTPSGGGGVDMAPGQWLSTATVDPINTSATQLTLGSTRVASANVSLATNILTLTEDGTYYVEYDVNFTQKDTLGAARGTVETWLEDDSGGGGYVLTPGSRGRTYIRETSYHGACHGSTMIIRSGTDVNIKLWAQKIYTSNPNIKSTALGTSVKIMRVA